jgi:hypothetical protein
LRAGENQPDDPTPAHARPLIHFSGPLTTKPPHRIGADFDAGIETCSIRSSSRPDGALSTGHVKTIGDLRSKLQHVLADVDTSDEQSMHEAREPALREILLWEFGSDFRQDAQFLPIVDAVKSVLDTDPQFQERFVELVRGLKANP